MRLSFDDFKNGRQNDPNYAEFNDLDKFFEAIV